jgi:hypothetical protein
MAMARRNTVELPIPLVKGPTEEVDRRIIPTGLLKRVQNMYPEKIGRWSCRNGYTALTMNDLSGGAITPAVRRLTHNGEAEVLFTDGAEPHPYIRDEDEWNPITNGKCNEVGRVEEELVARVAGHSITACASAFNAGFIGHCWTTQTNATGVTSYGGIAITEETTGNQVYFNDQVLAAASNARCFSSGQYIYFCMMDHTAAPTIVITLYRWDTAAPGTSPTSTVYATINTAVVGDQVYDIVATEHSGEEIAVIWADTGGSVGIATYNRSWILQNSTAIGGMANPKVAIWGTSAAGIYIATYDAANGLRGRWQTPTLGSPTALVTIAAAADVEVPFTIGPYTGTQAIYIWSDYYTPSGSAANLPRYGYRTANQVMTLGTAVWKYGTTVASKPFTETVGGTLRWYMWGEADDQSVKTEQKAFYLLEVNGTLTTPLARVAYRTADSIGYQGCANEVPALTTGRVWSTSVIFEGLVTAANPSAEVDAFRFTLSDPGQQLTARRNEAVYATGGTPWLWDGSQAFEVGFLNGPERVEVSAAGSGSFSGTFSYAAHYKFYDAAGDRHYSVVSAASTVTAASNTHVVVVVPYLQLTQKHLDLAVQITICRTLDGGADLYEVTDLPNVQGDATALTYNDSTTDANLADNPQLYTNNGTLPAFCPPSCDAIVMHGERLWVACGTQVFYSHKAVPGEAATFSEVLYLTIPETVTALASLDSALAIFTETAIYLLYGDGPNRAGQDAYRNPERLTSEAGCIEPRSLVVTPPGLMFQSARGLEMLPRGGGPVQHLGWAVVDQLAANPAITGAVLDSELSTARWTAVDDEASPSSGVVLCYDYEQQLWFWETAPDYSCADQWDDGLAVGSVSGNAVYQRGTGFTDPSSALIPMILETGDIRPSGVTGYQRVNRINILGELRSNSTLKLYVAYDGSDTYSESHSFAMTGTAGDPIRLEYAPAYQKCEAIRFKITNEGSSAGECFSLNAIQLQVKTKGGPSRLAIGKRG